MTALRWLTRREAPQPLLAHFAVTLMVAAGLVCLYVAAVLSGGA